MLDTFMARQAIFDQHMNVAGYELLFRNAETLSADIKDPDEATFHVLNIFIGNGLEKVTGAYPAYINLTRNLLLKPMIEVLPKDKIVIEILEDVEVDDLLIKSVCHLKSLGYTIALDDFELTEHNQALVEHADIIKLDVQAMDEHHLQTQIAYLTPYSATLLAEKIETYMMFQKCKQLGFNLFQGYFLCQPCIIKGQKVPTSRTILLQLLAKLHDPNAEIEDIVDLLCKDPGLSYKILRVINSSQFLLSRKIESLREAVIMLGLEQVRQYASLIMLSGCSLNKPDELFVTCLTRARMAQLIAEHLNRPVPEKYYIAGVFSTLDAMLDSPMDQLLKFLPLGDDIKQAILQREGPLGEALNIVIAYERGQWESINLVEVNEKDFAKMYLEALIWAQSIVDLCYAE